MAVVTTNLGTITAYGDAVAAGYTGTKAQWQALMANYATVGQQAAQDAQTASQAAQTATTKAGEASQSATAAAASAASITTPDATLTQAGVAADAKATGDEISDLKEDLSHLDERVADLEAGGSGGLSMTAVNLLNTILSEAVYGADQTANIALLKKELSNVAPVSISAVLDGTALAGQSYSELSFVVTATFDDDSTTVVDNYTVVTTGTVTAGSNTVTIKYRGVTTTCTFTAEQVTTYSIAYNLTDVTSSSDTTVVVENSYYSTTLSIPEDYGFNGCTVTMGGVDITATAYSNMEILITSVTGDVVITASATEYTYMDDLLPTREGGFSNMFAYPNGSDADTPLFTSNYYYLPYVSEYPAQNDCIVHWTIKNISDSDVSLASTAFGNIDPNNVYASNAATIKAFYCVKSDNSSHKLASGESLEGDVGIKRGMQLCFICNSNDFSKFEIKLRGNFVPNTFDGYTEINPTATNTQNYGAYRSVTYYKDDGSETLATLNDYPHNTSVSIEQGNYDLYYSVQSSVITNNIRNTYCVVGGMQTNTDASVNYAGGSKKGNGVAIWHHSSFRITDSEMVFILGGSVQYFDNTDTKLRIMYKKEVTA